MSHPIHRVWKITGLLVTSLLLLSCTLPSILTGRSQTIHSISPTSESEPNEQWTIEQCDATEDVSISLSDFEEVVYNEDGDIDCDYTHEILNMGTKPIRILYYKQFYYGDESAPNDHEYGWRKVNPIQPEETFSLSSSFSYCAECTPVQYESFIFTIAFVYDVPECRWITEGDSLHLDILHITEENLIFPPCELIYPLSFSEGIPDISEGLSH
jgi:hypothetical protein